ncbi:hypothetical protein [Tenacibaculum sp. 190524A05c]|uniref:hypothetical protein n=1 Tax=Tenacibaculum platacis TaxID=3137852 RepID=UPI0031FA9091
MDWYKIIKENIILHVLLVSILVLFSFCAGLFIKNWPILMLDKQIKITEVLGLGISVILAILIPVYLESVISRGKKKDETVLREVEKYREDVGVIQSRFLSFYQNGNLTSNNKTELFVLSEVLDSKFHSLDKMIKKRFYNKASESLDALKEKHIELWRVLTAEDILSEGVDNINDDMFEKGIRSYQNVEESIIKIIDFIT